MKKQSENLEKQLQSYLAQKKGMAHKPLRQLEIPKSPNFEAALLKALPVIGVLGIGALPAQGQIISGDLGTHIIFSTTGSSTSSTFAVNANLGFYFYLGSDYLDMQLINPNGRMFFDNLTDRNMRTFASGAAVPTTGTNNPNGAAAAHLTNNTGANGAFIDGTPFKSGIVAWHDSNQGTGYSNTNEGWIRVSVDERSSGSDNVVLRLHDFAYTTNNTPSSINAGQSTALPVELIRFGAKSGENEIFLSWETASETDNAGFELERSTDGKEFKVLGFIPGHGNTTEKQSYSYTDQQIKKGQKYYYRLKQIDYDGAFEYSPVTLARVNPDAKQNAKLYPNPSLDGHFTVDYTTLEDGDLQLEVYDGRGQNLNTQKIQVETGYQNFELNLKDLPKGMYFVKLQQGQNSLYKKVVIE